MLQGFLKKFLCAKNLNGLRCCPQNIFPMNILGRCCSTETNGSNPVNYPYDTFSKYITNQIDIMNDKKPNSPVKMYQLLDPNSNLHSSSNNQKMPIEIYQKILSTAIQVRILDEILNDFQRQGRISFYLQSKGEEIAIVSSCLGLQPTDMIFSQYRELGALYSRGYSLNNIMDHLFSTKKDQLKGRQMLLHFSVPELFWFSISSPLATQIPQAVGYSYAEKLKRNNRVTATYFGEGAASEGDCMTAMNFASVLKCPILFICRNNGIAISTPATEQYQGDGIISRSAGFNIASIRVDGCDALAVYSALITARKYITENQRPFLIELMAFRVCHHSTSDKSSFYRNNEQHKHFLEHYDGIKRLRNYLVKNNYWNVEKEQRMSLLFKENIINLFEQSENSIHPPIESMFDDVYDTIHPRLSKQKQLLFKHLEKYSKMYQTFEKFSK